MPLIPISINRALFSLSNRTGPFETSRFNYQTNPVSGNLPAPLKTLHERIFLNQTDTDYYLKNYLALLQGFPEFMRVLQDPLTSYTPADFEFPTVQITGGRFWSSGLYTGQVKILEVTELPVPRRYKLNHVTSLVADGRCKDTSRQHVIAVEPTTTVPGEYGPFLHVDWPESWPFAGILQLHQAWVPGASVDLVVNPADFPWELWNERLAVDSYLVSLLQRHNLMAIWATALTPKIKAAVALFAIIRAHPDVYPSDS
jgi:hypothetical protein